MDNFLSIMAVTLAILVAGGFLFALGVALYRMSLGFADLLELLFHGLLPLPPGHRAVLEKWSAYYQGLDPSDRKRFERRVKDLLYEKDWIGRGIKVTREMKLRIAGAAAQLTFGFDDLLLLHFSRIVIFPRQYRNRRTGNWHVGEVVPGGKAIVLSWEDFEQGFAHPTDARNVGLHEMAHALWFENRIDNEEYHFLEPRALKRWNQLAEQEIAQLKNGNGHFLREYAGTNREEFFAVAVEYFFEQPKEFNEALPELYRCMSSLLRQDPLSSGSLRKS